MSGIEELRQRVLDAEERFGLFNEQRAKYSGCLIGLMNTVEERIRDQQGEIERQNSAIDRHRAEIETQMAKIDGQDTAIARQAEEIEKLKASAACKAEENEQLRTMLHSLLQAIEAGSRDVLAEIMVQLDSKVSVLMDGGTPEAVAEPEEPAEIAAGTEEPVAEEPAESVSENEEPAAEEPTTEAEPVATKGAIATGDILDTPEVAEDSAEDPMAASEEPTAEEPVEPVAEAGEPAAGDVVEPAAEVAESAAPGSLDEIMERVSKLVQETDAVIAAPEPATAESDAAAPAEAPEEPAEEPAQQASAAAS